MYSHGVPIQTHRVIYILNTLAALYIQIVFIFLLHLKLNLKVYNVEVCLRYLIIEALMHVSFILSKEWKKHKQQTFYIFLSSFFTVFSMFPTFRYVKAN